MADPRIEFFRTRVDVEISVDFSEDRGVKSKGTEPLIHVCVFTNANGPSPTGERQGRGAF